MTMSRLQELINELCPDGVEYKKVGDVTFYEQPTKYIVKSTNYSDDFNIPVLTAGQSFILGYTNETDGIFEATKQEPVIIFDDFTGAFKWVDFPFKVKSSAMKLITSNEDVVLSRYLYHIMGVIGLTSTEHKRLWLSQYSEIKIPVPPLPVQEEIVKILDKMTDYVDELKAELKARKMQYQYYLDKLIWSSTDNIVELSSLGTLIRGKRFVHADATDDGVPCIHYGELYTYYGVYADIAKSHIREELRPKMRYASKGDVVIVGAGENNEDIGVGVAWFGDEGIAVHDACYTLKHNQNPKYISYYLRTTKYHQQIKKYVSEGKICSISAQGLGKSLVPLPDINVQNDIVSKLDKYDTLCNDITVGLPAEIEARQKQYEYYRDKLLTFKELKHDTI